MSYDRFAPFYKLVETMVFGRALQEARCAGLGGEAPKSVLIIGDGNGRYLEQAIRAWPEARFVSIDASEGMLKEARKRVGKADVRFIHAEVFAGLEEVRDETFELIATHFFLDCFREETLEKLIPMMANKLADAGRWDISDFTDRRLYHRAMLWLMYRFFHNFTETPAKRLPDYGRILRDQGLVSSTLGSWRAGFVIAQRWRRKRGVV